MSTYRKHPAVYIGLIMRMIIWLAALVAFFAYNIPGATMGRSVALSDVPWTIHVAASSTAALLIARDFYLMLVLHSISIIVSGNGVEYRKGVLPWKKVTWFWHPKQIFSASSSHGFLGWLFKAATVHIIGAEGTTSLFVETWIGRGSRCTQEINALTLGSSPPRTAALAPNALRGS